MLLTPLSAIAEPQTITVVKPTHEIKVKSINIAALFFDVPFFKTPEYICNAAIGAINEGYTRYIRVAGDADISETISIALKRDNNLGLCN